MRVAVYARVSTQNHSQAQTSEHHLDLIQTHRQAQGWEWQDVALFRDAGSSGASLKRPGLDRLREHVAQATCALIRMTAPDRLARN